MSGILEAYSLGFSNEDLHKAVWSYAYDGAVKAIVSPKSGFGMDVLRAMAVQGKEAKGFVNTDSYYELLERSVKTTEKGILNKKADPLAVVVAAFGDSLRRVTMLNNEDLGTESSALESSYAERFLSDYVSRSEENERERAGQIEVNIPADLIRRMYEWRKWGVILDFYGQEKSMVEQGLAVQSILEAVMDPVEIEVFIGFGVELGSIQAELLPDLLKSVGCTSLENDTQPKLGHNVVHTHITLGKVSNLVELISYLSEKGIMARAKINTIYGLQRVGYLSSPKDSKFHPE
jgi:hypothetical protein